MAASFLGQQAFRDVGAPWLTLTALVSFVVSMASAIFILAPDRDLYFSIRGRALYESLFEIRDDGVDVYRRLVFDLDRYWSVNDSQIRLLTRA